LPSRVAVATMPGVSSSGIEMVNCAMGVFF